MKPHSLRRGLWLANFVLGAAVLGVAAWFALKVRPAVAKVTSRPANVRPAEWEKLRKEYEGQRLSGLKWKPAMPVTDVELKDVILRKDFEMKRPRHWIFSGPLPPPDPVDTGPVESGPPPPQGLEVLGSITSLIYIPPSDSVILFDFSGKSLAFSVGDYVRKSDADPKRFRITGVKEIRPRVFEVAYAIVDKDPAKPEGAATMIYDQSGAEGGYADFLRPEGGTEGGAPASGSPAAGAPGENPEGTGAPGEGAKPPAKDDGTWVKGSEKPPEVVDVAGASAENLTLQDLKPEIEYNPNNRNQRAIKFDDNSYRYFRGKNAKSVAETVKTSIAKDNNGNVIGLRITGFAENAPADVFDVRRGDILVSINGQKVTTRADAIRIAEGLSPEKLVTVVIDRLGKLITYRVDPTDPKTRRNVRYFENLR